MDWSVNSSCKLQHRSQLIFRTTYFSTDKTIAKINIVLSGDPYSAATLDTVAQLRKAAASRHQRLNSGGKLALCRRTRAPYRPILCSVNDADFGRVVGLAIAGILIVIMILLRSLLAPLYMVATVLLNYGTTLGITTWLFLDVMKARQPDLHDTVIHLCNSGGAGRRLQYLPCLTYPGRGPAEDR